MRALSGTLMAAQKGPARAPAVTVEVHEREANVVRLVWEQLYAGSEPEATHALAMPADGSLVRVRSDAATSLYYQRVVNPGPGSDFSSWTALSVGDVGANPPVGAAASGTEVLVVHGLSDRRGLRWRRSLDSGALFSSFGDFPLHTQTIVAVAVALKADGTALVVFGDVEGDVYTLKRTGGVWGSATLWSRDVATVQGLACIHSGDWLVVVTGTKAGTSQPVLNTVVYGDGVGFPAGVWSGLSEVMLSDTSDVVYQWPSLVEVDTFRLWFVESAFSVARLHASFTPNSGAYLSGHWREPAVDVVQLASYGTAVAKSSSYAWRSTARGVWRAPLSPSVGDLSGRVLSLEMDESGGQMGRLRLVLEARSTVPSVKVGQQLRVRLGLATSAGVETSGLPYVWVTEVERTERGELAVEGEDWWGLLERWVARQQIVFSGQSLAAIVQYILARAGLDWSNTGTSSQFQALQPSFTVHAGESGAVALRRLLAMVPDVAYGQQGLVRLREPTASEAPVYSYGTNHVISRTVSGVLTGPTRVRVVGNGVRGEAVDWTLLGEIGREELVLVRDMNLTTAQQAADRAAAELRKRGALVGHSEAVVPVNCGQELYDVVTVTDSRVGLSGAVRRVVGMQHRYSRQRPRYEQVLRLGER